MALGNFPLVSQNFINSFSGTVKYVDAILGSDSNNGDSESAAYQTLSYAQSQTAAISTAVMYVINPGTYNLTATTVTSNGSAGFSDANLPRTFFCAPDGQVVFQWTAGTQRDGTMVSLQNAASAVYGAVFKRNNNGKTDTYSVAMFNNTTTYCQGDFYNCVFIETNANGNWSLQYDNNGNSSSTVNNCTFYTIENGSNDWSSSTTFVLNNCAFNYTYGAGSATKNNTVINQTIDATSYELTENNSTYGVYSGAYAWGQPRPDADLEIEYLVVGGGGGGGETIGGGGGGGQVVTGNMRMAPDDLAQMIIGAGGLGGFTGVTGATAYPGGYSGDPTYITGVRLVSARGGGAGGGYNEAGTSPESTGGGNGGGQGAGGGAGVAPGSGLNSGGTSASNTNSGAGGGGGGAVGSNATSGFPGAGGNGIEWPLGSGVYFGGGGGGGARDPGGGTGASGGLGGGGSGGTSNNNGTAGTANTGGGGGGGGYRNSDTFQGAGGDGGSGVVKIQYPGNPKAIGGEIVTSNGYTVHTFNTNGNLSRAAVYVGFQITAPNDFPVFTTTANEGDTVTVKFKSENQTGVINYSITGVSSNDINGATLSGTVDIVDYEASFNLNISEEASINEGNETLTVSFVENSQTYQESLTILDTSRQLFVTQTVNTGGTITVRLNTINNPQLDGTQIPYTISGTYITELSIGRPLTGVFTMLNNVSEFTINLTLISSTTLTVSSFGDSASCSIVFNPNIADLVIDTDTYVDVEATTKTFSILPLSDRSVADSSSNIDPEKIQGMVYLEKVNFLGTAEPTLITQTTENDVGNDITPGGMINFPQVAVPTLFTQTTQTDLGNDTFVVQPLGVELIREYWI